MFDDPKKALRQMEEALWEEEAQEELPEEEEDWLSDAKALLEEREEPARPRETLKRNKGRNDAVDFHRTVYADEEDKETKAVFVEKPKGKKSGMLSLVILLELAGIAGIVWWWFRWLS